MPPRHGGSGHKHGKPDLRLRHGEVSQDRLPRAPHDRARGIRPRQGHQNRVHRPQARGEALRGGPLQARGHGPHVTRAHTHSQGARVRLRHRLPRLRPAPPARPRRRHTRSHQAHEGHRA